MSDAYRNPASSWSLGSKVLPFAVLAVAGLGCLVALFNGREAGDGGAARRAGRAPGRTIRTEEPMAGYGR